MDSVIEHLLGLFGQRMQSRVVAMLMPAGSPGAALLVRRSDGQFAFERVDVRVAFAARAAASWSRRDGSGADQNGSALIASRCLV
jgi:hypothetical protein